MSPIDDELHGDPPMQRRRTTMPDGRYLYYYTFDDEVNSDGGTPDTERSDNADETESGNV